MDFFTFAEIKEFVKEYQQEEGGIDNVLLGMIANRDPSQSMVSSRLSQFSQTMEMLDRALENQTVKRKGSVRRNTKRVQENELHMHDHPTVFITE